MKNNRQKRLTNRLTIRLSDVELLRLKEQAKHTELSESEYLRQSIYGRPFSTEAIRELRLELSKIGVNINMLSKSAMTSGHNNNLYIQSAKYIEEVRERLQFMMAGCI